VIVVADVGGTYVRCAAVTQGAALHDVQRCRLPGPAERGDTRLIWDRILDAICGFAERVGGPERMVVAVPGPVARATVLLSAPTLATDPPAMPDLHGELERRSGRRVHLLNDLSAAAWYVHSITDASRFMVVTVGSGVGSKVFDRDHPSGVLDELPYSGELGHLVVDTSWDATPCGCGGRGHLGTIASGRGIERRAREAAARDPRGFGDSACAARGATPATLTNEDHLVPAAHARDPWALAVIRESSRPLARVLTTVAIAVGLERILVFGGFPQAVGEPYLELLREEMSALADYPLLPRRLADLVVLADPGDEVCLRGAAQFALRLTDGVE
jgi:glucokinase